MADPPPEPDAGENPPAAAPEEEKNEYESDAEEALFPAMRRREASDDEGSEAGKHPPRPRARISSDREDDGQGAAEVYEDEADDYGDKEEFEEVGEELEEEYNGGWGGDKAVAGCEGSREEEVEVEDEKAGDGEGEGEEKKENEPYAVPTSGVFYMHDDRFQDNGRGRRRRMLSERKLWDATDDHVWLHDRFEEMNLQEEHYKDKQMSRGRFRGRGGGSKTRGTARYFSRGDNYRSNQEDGNNQNRTLKVVRGRGPRRYESVAKNCEVVGSQRRQSRRSQEHTANPAIVRVSSHILNAPPEAAPPKKNVFGSNLNSSSPPFYPSRTSNQDYPVTKRRDVQTGGSSQVLQSSMKMDGNFKMQSSSVMRGRTVMDSGGRDRLYVDGTVTTVRSSPARTVGTSLSSLDFTVPSTSPGQSPSVRAQGGSSNIGIPSNNQPTSSIDQISRVSTQQQSHTSIVHQKPVHVLTQPAMQMPIQQFSHRTGNKSSPPSQHLAAMLTEGGENGSYPSSNKATAPSDGVEKTNSQETGRGSFVYSGARVLGASRAVGSAQGEQTFPGTPALLPVMQFGDQHPGDLGLPAVGLALPGYVAQQQPSDNEATWLPALAGAPGAFGASYPPYIALDASFYSRSSGQTTSSSSREPSTIKGAKSPRNDIVNEELDQRQDKPRRQDNPLDHCASVETISMPFFFTHIFTLCLHLIP